MAEYFAVPLTLTPIPKVSYILTRTSEHDGWFSDFQKGRREIVAALLTDPANVIFEVWRTSDAEAGSQPVGLVVFTDITPYVNAEFHPIFFDGKLANALGKRNLLLSLLLWAFQNLAVERISIEIPEFAGPLIHYARKKLGFRFEAEGRMITRWTKVSRRRSERVQETPTAAQAALGSRKHRIVRYRGEWHDLILLSVTRGEFADFLAATYSHGGASDGRILQEAAAVPSGPEGPTGVPGGAGGSGPELDEPVGGPGPAADGPPATTGG